ncbi:hypothetical protein JOD20_003288 [Herpetosiphon giganteus]|nr:hypothetical protein [Herpetosiphon giganteus]
MDRAKAGLALQFLWDIPCLIIYPQRMYVYQFCN